VSLAHAACGNKGPPRPPIQILPTSIQGLNLSQIGDEVIVRAVLPPEGTDGAPLEKPLTVRILRMPGTDELRPGSVSVRYLLGQFRKQAEVVAVLEGDELARAAPEGRLRVADRQEGATGPGISRRYLYSVMLIDGSGQESPLPLPRPIDIVDPAPPPAQLEIETAEGEVRLSWKSGGPGGVGYNLYRRPAVQADYPPRPLNLTAIMETSFVDSEFSYGEIYRYVVRTLSTLDPPRRESSSSPEEEARPVDIYPPAPPGGVAASAEGSVIKLYWFPNSEADLGGYRIYRREERDVAFDLLGEAEPAETTFVDDTARAGVRYHYTITAVDGAAPPNESERSEEKAEMIPLRDDPAPAAPGESTPDPGER
jgi:hypothetical protein